MLFVILKSIHVLAAILFLGFGLGSVYYRWRAYRSGDLAALAFCDREIVRADWWFTVPAGVLLPVTGLWMVELFHLPWSTPWVAVGLGGYTLAGLTWLPAAVLQLRLRALSTVALRAGEPLPASYHRAHRAWLWLGVPSFLATMFVLWAMVAKWAMLGI